MEIRFIELMPTWYAWIIIIFQFLLVLALGFLLLSFAEWIRDKFRSKKTAAGTNGNGLSNTPPISEPPDKIEIKDLEGAWESTADSLHFRTGKRYSRSPFDHGTPVERGSYQIVHQEDKTLLRLFGSMQGEVHNRAVPADWEIIHWDKRALDLAQSGRVIHYKRHKGPDEESP